MLRSHFGSAAHLIVGISLTRILQWDLVWGVLRGIGNRGGGGMREQEVSSCEGGGSTEIRRTTAENLRAGRLLKTRVPGSRVRPAWCAARRPFSGGHWGRDVVVQSPERSEEAAADGFAAKQLQVGLAPMGGKLCGKPEQPEAEPIRLGRPPGTREEVLAQHMQGLVSHDGETPQEGIAPEVVHGGLTGRELGELLDPLLHHGTVVVATPGGQSLDALDVGQHVRLELDIAGIELQHSPGLDRLSGLDREETHIPE